MTLLIAFAFLAIGVSFLCSVLEAVLLSITPSYIVSLKETQPNLYKRLSVLKERIDQPLAAILTLNTVAHTFGAAGVGAQVGIVFGDGYLAASSAILTFLVLILSEIIPKTLGAKYWDKLAPLLPPILNGMILMLKPFIKLSDIITRSLGKETPKTDIRSQIKALTKLGREEKMLDDDEQRVIENILDLHEVQLRDILTPRTVCQYIKLDSTTADNKNKLRETSFSRYPVLDENEHPQGIVFRNELLDDNETTAISELMSPVKIFKETDSAEFALTSLLKENQHMGLVFDGYGTWLGLITMEDIFESILGLTIMDETDNIPNMRRHARRRWENRMKQTQNQSD
jgi:CBS domain containing-hemolysin-like protein